MEILDAHCHAHRLVGVVSRWPDRILCCSAAPGEWDSVAAWCSGHAGAEASFGIHPWFADQCTDAVLADLARRLDADPAAGVGEIGLHYAKPYANRDEQVQCFRAQLKIARLLQCRVSIHCVQAWGALLETLDDVGVPDGCWMVVHDFSGSVEMARELVSRGIYLSCKPSAQRAKLQQVVAAIDPAFLLVETDAGGQPAETHYDYSVLAAAAVQVKRWRDQARGWASE